MVVNGNAISDSKKEEIPVSKNLNKVLNMELEELQAMLIRLNGSFFITQMIKKNVRKRLQLLNLLPRKARFINLKLREENSFLKF